MPLKAKFPEIPKKFKEKEDDPRNSSSSRGSLYIKAQACFLIVAASDKFQIQSPNVQFVLQSSQENFQMQNPIGNTLVNIGN